VVGVVLELVRHIHVSKNRYPEQDGYDWCGMNRRGCHLIFDATVLFVPWMFV